MGLERCFFNIVICKLDRIKSPSFCYGYNFNLMSDAVELFRGFVGGAVAGWAQVFVMQPFEIIKVRLVNQSLLNPQYMGIRDCFSRILKEEGPLAFYRGSQRYI